MAKMGEGEEIAESNGLGSAATCAAPPDEAKKVEKKQIFSITFATAGTLGIEFKEPAAPYIVEEIEGGLAVGKGLERGDMLISVGGEAVGGLAWEELVQLLTTRPTVATFERDLADKPRAEDCKRLVQDVDVLSGR